MSAMSALTFEELLIESVRIRPVLFNLKNPDYHNSSIKQKAWSDVLEQLHDYGFQCEGIPQLIKRWKTIKDYYSKLKKERETQTRSGAKGTKPIKWPHFFVLSFLDDYNQKQPRVLRTSGNRPSTFSVDNACSLASESQSEVSSNEGCMTPTDHLKAELDVDLDCENSIPDHQYTASSNIPVRLCCNSNSTRTKTHSEMNNQACIVETRKTEELFADLVADVLGRMDEEQKKEKMRDISLILFA